MPMRSTVLLLNINERLSPPLFFIFYLQLNPFITNRSVRPKASFRYNRSIFKEIYAIFENDVLSYN
jgi:hypothetical protein